MTPTAMYRFHVTVHALPPDTPRGEPIVLSGGEFRPLALASNQLSTAYPITFEQTYAQLQLLDRMDCEPDGYFVWVGGQENNRWQIDGHLFDRDERLLYVELKGECPQEQFDELLTTLSWPETPLVFQLVREAVILDEQEFRRYVSP